MEVKQVFKDVSFQNHFLSLSLNQQNDEEKRP